MLKLVLIIGTTLFILVGVFLLALRIPTLKLTANASDKQHLQALHQWLTEIHQSGKFNGSVLLAKQGRLIFSQSYGFADLAETRPLTEHSTFNLASVSKQFTAMGIVLLKQQGKLYYSDSLAKFIPELAQYPDITILQLLQHTSGLPEYMPLVAKSDWQGEVFTINEMLKIYQQQRPKLRFTPGAKFEYCNSGYVLLAEIIARVSGETFADFMQRSIFQPLMMQDTQVFHLLSAEEPNHRVYGFKRRFKVFGGAKKPQDLNYYDGIVGDGGIYSSAFDLYLWHQALQAGTLLADADYQQAYHPATLTDGSQSKYGFGWVLNEDKTVEHAGGWQGFATYIHRNREKDELIVVLDNSSNVLRVGSAGFRFNSIGLNLQDFMKTLSAP